MAYVSDEELFPIWREPRSFWERSGLTAGQRRGLDVVLVAVIALVLGGWIYSVAAAVTRGASPRFARAIGTPSAAGAARPSPVFLLDAALREFATDREFRGISGAVRVVLTEPGDSVALPDSLPPGVRVEYESVADDSSRVATGRRPPSRPGIWSLLLEIGSAARQVPDLTVITPVSTALLEGGRIDGYRIGSWPNETGMYAPPRGLVRVTPENMNTYVSTHVQLKDLLTKGQEDVWPKYLVLSPRELDKVELTLQELGREGHPVEHIFVISGFRTPYYNAYGGNTSGRGDLSRHMYGDAMDIAIDNDQDGRMDDLNGDGRVTVADARILADAAETVEERYPDLVGGIGVYAPTSAHAGFVHIDTRGKRARWGAW